MTVLLQILAPLVLNLPFTLSTAWEATTSARLAARVNAMRAAGEPVTMADVATTYPEPPAGKNAADTYEAAFKAFDDLHLQDAGQDLPIIGTGKLPEADQDLPPDELADVGAYVKVCEVPLRLLHQAAALDEAKFPVDLTKGFAMLLPHLSKMRGGGRRLLAMEALWRGETGKPEEAADSIWAGLRIGHALRREPILISSLVRIACDNIAVGQLERLVSRASLPPGELEKLESALRAEADPRMMERCFVAERACGMDTYKDQFIQHGGDALQALGMAEPMVFRLLPRAYFKADLVAYIDLMNLYVATAKKPYPQSFLEGARLGPRIDEQIPKYYVICRMILPALSRVFVSAQRHMAKMDTARTALACLRYKTKHERLPAKLADLPPAFLDSVPCDPFDGKPLRYLRDATGFVIYSVGENGKDDGGKIEAKDGQPPDVGFRVRWPKGHF